MKIIKRLKNLNYLKNVKKNNIEEENKVEKYEYIKTFIEEFFQNCENNFGFLNKIDYIKIWKWKSYEFPKKILYQKILII